MAAFGVRFIGWVENIIIGAEGGMTISLKPHICIPSALRVTSATSIMYSRGSSNKILKNVI